MRKLFAYMMLPFAFAFRLIEIVFRYLHLAVSWVAMKLGTYIIIALSGEDELMVIYAEKIIRGKD